MHEAFMALDKGKRDRIINAAMREFAEKGFKSASTNEIVKQAGISKGGLFHYFSSKQDLLEFLCRYGIGFFMETVDPRIHEMPADVFERWIAFAALKIEIAAQHPDLADFMQRAYRESAHKAGNLYRNEFERVSLMLQAKIYDGIDLSKFRPDVDVTKALQTIWWVLEGFSVSKQRKPLDLSEIKEAEFLQSLVMEIGSYLDMLKKAFYRAEYP